MQKIKRQKRNAEIGYIFVRKEIYFYDTIIGFVNLVEAKKKKIRVLHYKSIKIIFLFLKLQILKNL